MGQDNISDPDIALTVANQIAKNDLKLNDAYALLDEDKDGVLTIKEIQNNICRLKYFYLYIQFKYKGIRNIIIYKNVRLEQ